MYPSELDFIHQQLSADQLWAIEQERIIKKRRHEIKQIEALTKKVDRLKLQLDQKKQSG